MDFSIDHTFNLNWLYDLPIGPGKRFATGGGVVGKLLEGWQLAGLLSWHTAPYKNITSGRATFNQNNSWLVPVVPDAVDTVQRNIGVFKRPEGVFWLNPELLNITINPATGLASGATLKPGLFRHPEAGELGYPEKTFSSPPGSSSRI
jgi:hypothetical protein